MGGLVDNLNSVRIQGWSVDRTVCVVVARQFETIIKLENRARIIHNEYDLAELVESTVLDAWGQMREALLRIKKDYGLHAPGTLESAPQQIRDMFAEINAIECTAESDHGYVEATVSGSDDLFIHFAKSAVRRTDLSTAVLEREIEEAIRKARRELASEVRKLYTNKNATKVARDGLPWPGSRSRP